MQELLGAARRRDGICPLCCTNLLLPEPYEYEVSKEPLRSAKELIHSGESYGVEMQGTHSVTDEGPECGKIDFSVRPDPTMADVDPYVFRSTKGSLSDTWWKGEASILSK